MVKFITKTVLALAFIGLSAGAFAQSTYIITGSGTQFTVYKDGTPLLANQPIQSVIDAVKINAGGADCIIQFENSGNTLNTGADNITFDGGANGTAWGLITLTGKLTSTSVMWDGGTICLKNGASANSKADITNPGGGDAIAIYHQSTGTLTISEGTVKNTGTTTVTIIAGGPINITGGRVEATGVNATAIAIMGGAEGKVTISGDAVVTSKNIHEYIQGTIFVGYDADGDCLEIAGGTVENTANLGVAIANFSATATVNISGGTVSATSGSAVRNEGANGTVNISGGTVSTTTGIAVLNLQGTTNISGGTITGGTAVENDGSMLTISGGTMLTTGENSYTVQNYGPLTISGGMISATGEHGRAVYNESTTTITGGTIMATGGLVAFNNGTAIIITGGILFAYGTSTNNVLFDCDISGDAVVVTWDADAGNTEYDANTDDDIFKDPTAAVAVWSKQGDESGIAVNYGATNGFVPVAGVTVGNMPAIVSLDISPETATVQPGGTQQFTALIVAEGGADESVTWSVAGTLSALTTISADGLLTVGSNEIAESFTVTVVSVFDPAFSAVATVTVYTGSDPKVLGVTISPKTATVGQGKTQQFNVTVNAVGGADESVTWSVMGNLSTATTVNATGLLTVGSNETAPTLIVKVASVFDPDVFDEATVTIGDVGIVETPLMASVQVYPNPTSGLITICDMRCAICDVTIYDIMGRTVLATLAVAPNGTHQLQIGASAPAGVYFLRITTENGVVTKKVVKR